MGGYRYQKTYTTWYETGVHCHTTNADCSTCPANAVITRETGCHQPESNELLIKKIGEPPPVLGNTYARNPKYTKRKKKRRKRKSV